GLHLIYAPVGQGVGALVPFVARMTLDPAPADVVAGAGGVQAPPQVLVLDRLPVGRLPAARLPAVDPLVDALHDVFAVGVQLDLAGAGQGLQRLDGGHQLHAVVGGQRLAAPQFLLMVAPVHHRAPAAGAGIAATGAVGVDDDVG